MSAKKIAKAFIEPDDLMADQPTTEEAHGSNVETIKSQKSKEANDDPFLTEGRSIKEVLALIKVRDAAKPVTSTPATSAPAKASKGKGGSIFDFAAKRKQAETSNLAQDDVGTAARETHEDGKRKPHLATTIESDEAPSRTPACNDKPRFPTEALGNMKDAVLTMAASIQVAPSMVAGVLIAFLSAILQAFFNVSQRSSGNGMPLSINMFLIADSGERKSSTVYAVAKPLYQALLKILDDRKHMLVQDVTVDGLVVGLIKRCPSQMLLVPEAATLLSSHAMSKENLMRFLGIVSSLFSGEAISRTRVDEHHYALGRRLNALIMSQPVVAMEFLGSDLVMQQGLGNRFLYDTPESMRGMRLFSDHDLDSNPDYLDYCEYIDMMVSRAMIVNEATSGVDVQVIRLSPGAKALWVDHYNTLELGIGEGGPFATHAEYVQRFPEQTLRLAGILTLIEGMDAEEITEDAMARALMLSDYYLHTALQLFTKAPADNDELQAQALLSWMHKKQLELNLPAIPVRMIYRDGPHNIRSVERTRKLLNILEERGDVSKYEGTVRYANGKRSGDNYSANID